MLCLWPPLQEIERLPSAPGPSPGPGPVAAAARPLPRLALRPHPPPLPPALEEDYTAPPETPIRPSLSSWCLLNPEGCCQQPVSGLPPSPLSPLPHPFDSISPLPSPPDRPSPPVAWDSGAVLVPRPPATAAPQLGGAAAAAPWEPGGLALHASAAEPAGAAGPAVLSEDWVPWSPLEAAARSQVLLPQPQASGAPAGPAADAEEMWSAVIGRYGYRPEVAADAADASEPAGAAAESSLRGSRGGGGGRAGASRPAVPPQLAAARAEAFLEEGWFGGSPGNSGGRSPRGRRSRAGRSGSLKQRVQGWLQGVVERMQEGVNT